MNVPGAKPAGEAEAYYDDSSADAFYRTLWGGEDIHIGIYQNGDVGVEGIRTASHRTVEAMIRLLLPQEASGRVLDIGAGYGGAARAIARVRELPVACLNISEVQNRRNRELTAAAGLDPLVSVYHGSFEDLPFDDNSFEAVWSQDAILHSGDRKRVLDEVHRVLKPGGQFLFTDPMQTPEADSDSLAPILNRINLSSLGTLAFYRRGAAQLGWAETLWLPMPEHLQTHYTAVRQQLRDNRTALEEVCSPGYLDRMDTGLGHWIEGASAGRLTWGILSFRRP